MKLLFLLPALAFAQPQSYTKNCVACHGPEAEGTGQGPRLTSNRRLRARSLAQVRSFIQQGSPSTGMPPFALPAPELDELAAWVRSLNSPAADAHVPGSPAAGERFFAGDGRCLTCHMVRGRGNGTGPDLSNAGRELTVSDFRQALLHPGAHTTPGYDLVSVQLRDGRTLRGFARNRTNFDLQLQTPDGQWQMLRQSEIASIREEKQSVMKPLTATPTDMQDLVAYL